MKNYFVLAMYAILLVSCAGSKSVTTDVSRKTSESLEGEQVNTETLKWTGIEKAESLNSDGTEIIFVPFKWFLGMGKADNKQVAVELAQREAYATISRVLHNAVYDTAGQYDLGVNSHVQQALSSYWEQVSSSIQRGCEPYGDVTIAYSQSTHMYDVTAKVAIRGDRFNKMLNDAGAHQPQNLKGEELEQFIELNRAIITAVKGNQ